MSDRTDSRSIYRASNDLNNDVQLMAARFDQALDLLEQWVITYPDDQFLVISTRSLLTRGGREVVGDE